MRQDNSSKRVMNGLFWVYLENISSQAVTFIVTIVLARLLTPDDYGVVALLAVFTGLAQVFVTSGISSGLIQKKNADDLDYSSMFWFTAALSIILYLLLYLSAPTLGRYYNNEDLVLVLRVMSLSIPLSAYNSIQQAYVSSKMVFKKSFLSNSGAVIVSGLTGVAMALMGSGLWALVWQRIIFVFVTTLILQMVIPWYPRFQFSWNRVKPLFSYGWKIMATSFLFTAYSDIRSLIIGKRYSAADLGFYDRGFSFPKLIASNIDSTINRVLFPALSHDQDSQDLLSLKTRRAAKTSAYVMTPILWGLAVVASPLVLLLLGEKWLPCVPFLQIMCFVWWLQPTQSCSLQAIRAIGRSDLSLYIEIVSKVIGLALLAFAVLIIDSVMAIAMMYLAGQVISVFLYGYCSSKYIGYRLRHQLLDLLIPALLSLIMCSCAYLIMLVIENVIICLVMQSIICCVLYVGLSVITKNESYYYIIGTLGLNGFVGKRLKKR